MAFREVSVVQVREALRRWLRGDGERPIATGVGVDRKTARRYITAAVEVGLDRHGGEEQLTDELIGQVVERVRPRRPDGHGPAWRTLLAQDAPGLPPTRAGEEAGAGPCRSGVPARPRRRAGTATLPYPPSPEQEFDVRIFG